LQEAEMIVRLRDGMLIVTPHEGETLAEWLAAHAGQVFRLSAIQGGSALLQAFGPEAEACRIPVNITSQAPEPLRLASNFAHTPFELDGLRYESIEGISQGPTRPTDGGSPRSTDPQRATRATTRRRRTRSSTPARPCGSAPTITGG
jgi:hypothetical protein